MTAKPNTYSEVAAEYYDSIAHPTCFNFNQLSRHYINQHLSNVNEQSYILEIGAGSSSAAEFLHSKGLPLNRLHITDASSEMLKHSECWLDAGAKLSVGDATKLSSSNSSVSLLVAGLCDPYNLPQFWSEVSRVLDKLGRVVITTPSFEWAIRFRGKTELGTVNLAEFTLRDGTKVNLPSYICSLKEQINMIENAGLRVTNFSELGHAHLGGERLSPKILVFDNDDSSIIWGFTAVKR